MKRGLVKKYAVGQSRKKVHQPAISVLREKAYPMFLPRLSWMACLGIIMTLQQLSAPALARNLPDELKAKLVMANPCAFSTFNNGLIVN